MTSVPLRVNVGDVIYKDNIMISDKYPVVVKGAPLSIEISTVDNNLKYTSISNPHKYFDKKNYLGKRDDQIDQRSGSILLQEIKSQVINSQTSKSAIIEFSSMGETKTCSVSVEPLYDENGVLCGATCVSVDISNYIAAISNKDEIIIELQHALLKSKSIDGILPVCSNCKSVKDEQGNWHKFDSYISRHTNARLSHGICPDCLKVLYPEYTKN